MKSNTCRAIQYPWGTQCPLRWPKVFLAASGHALSDTDLIARVQADIKGFENYEILGNGEVLFDLSRQQREFCSPVQMAEQLTMQLQGYLGGELSTGLAADALTAIYAARQSSSGLSLVPAWDAQRVLSGAPIECLDSVLSGVSTLLKGLGYQSVGQLGQQRDQVLTYRYGELGRAIQLLARGQSVPQQYWYKSPPLSVSVKGRLSRRDGEQASHRINALKEKVSQRYARLGFSAKRWTLFFRRSTETHFQPAADVGVVLDALCEGASMDVRWVASEWCVQRVQQDLFDLDGDVPAMPTAMAGQGFNQQPRLH
ncbi:hypothetical protein GP5015_1521 [gamma proteobacterium HTCC5015]|nr:hypothetical protein GP5015_1521 [gamma proteobacterium HTCC5015]